MVGIHEMVTELNKKFPIHSTSRALGLNIPNIHAQTCFAVLEGKSKVQVSCNFSFQREPVEKRCFKKLVYLWNRRAKALFIILTISVKEGPHSLVVW